MNWKWLLITVALFSLGEFFTIYKVLSHHPLTNKRYNLAPKEKGYLAGKVVVHALTATLSTMALAIMIKLIKDLISTHLF